MVNYFTSVPAMINGRQVFAQFSNHGELRTDPANRTNQQAHVALAQATDLYETAQKGGPNCVLRVSIMNMMFPVTIDVLHQVMPIVEHDHHSSTFVYRLDIQQIRDSAENNHFYKEWSDN
jgi:hypothetical protein